MSAIDKLFLGITPLSTPPETEVPTVQQAWGKRLSVSIKIIIITENLFNINFQGFTSILMVPLADAPFESLTSI